MTPATISIQAFQAFILPSFLLPDRIYQLFLKSWQVPEAGLEAKNFCSKL
jgi:hypothetical protein